MANYGTPGNDRFELSVPISDETIDLDLGYDVLVLANGSNDLTVIRTEEVLGGTGNDIVTAGDTNLSYFDGGLGENTLLLSSGNNSVVVRNTSAIYAEAGNDSLTLFTTGNRDYYLDPGQGFDAVSVINIESSTRSRTVVNNVDQLSLQGAVDVSVLNRMFNVEVTAAAGSDAVLNLQVSDDEEKTDNLISVRGNLQVNGGEGRDIVRALDSSGESVFSLGAGLDRVELMGIGSHAVSVRDVEALLGSNGTDVVKVLGAAPADMSIDLGGGIDTLSLTGGALGTVRVSNVERLYGSDGNETIMVRTPAQNMYINMGGGYDQVALSDGRNSVTVDGVEFVVGGSGVDRITVGAGATSGTVMLGGEGADILTGGDADDVINGGAGKDIMTGGAGADRFLFTAIRDSDLDTRDIINDFQPGVDCLEFHGLQHGTFSLTVEDAFSGFQANGNSQAHFIDATDQLLIDSNGDGQMDMRMALLGVDGTQLTVSDFVWNFPA